MAPALAAGFLAALGVTELARLYRAIRIENSEAPVGAVPIAPTSTNRGIDVQALMVAHLFGEPPHSPSAGDGAEAAATTADLVLDGTIASRDPKRGIAIISDGGHAKTYLVGDSLAGRSLYSVYLDHVILERGGVFETLRFRHQQLSFAGGVLTARSDSAPAAAPMTKRTYLDSLGRVIDKPPGRLDSVMRMANLVDDATGKMTGVRVYPLANGKLQSLGLYPGDVLTAINGAPLDDLKRSREALDALGSSSESTATVTVERQNQKLNLVLNLAEATQTADAASAEAQGSAAAPEQN
jgi:general secretion pathway protein C